VNADARRTRVQHAAQPLRATIIQNGVTPTPRLRSAKRGRHLADNQIDEPLRL
jgi:hypothetical protein